MRLCLIRLGIQTNSFIQINTSEQGVNFSEVFVLSCLIKTPNKIKHQQFKIELKKYINYYNIKRIKAKFKMSPIEYRTHFDQAS